MSRNKPINASKGALFAGCSIVMIRKKIGNVQYQAIKRRVEDRSGEVSETFDVETTTHVVSALPTYEDVLVELNVQSLPTHQDHSKLVGVHQLAWVTECLKQSCLFTGEILSLKPTQAGDDHDVPLSSQSNVARRNRSESFCFHPYRPSFPSCKRPSFVSSNDDDDSDNESGNASTGLSRSSSNNAKKQYLPWWKDKTKLACQRVELPPEEKKMNHNKLLTDALEKLMKQEHVQGRQWQEVSYRKASAILKNKPQVKSKADALKIRGIGEKIACKIGEILETGTLARLEKPDEIMSARMLFADVWGAGPTTANRWVVDGCRTLEDLKSRHLNRQQQIGLKHYADFQHRIPRDEVALIEHEVFRVAEQVDKDLTCLTCGSYRRGRLTCGDVDILITHAHKTGMSVMHGALGRILGILREEGFLTDDLSVGSDKYMGVCRVSSEHLHRRIDIKVFPKEQFPCAVLYFTGSDHFNRSMRMWAGRNGMKLNEKELVGRIRPRRNDKASEVILSAVEVLTEEDVFKALGLDYKDPKDRDV